MFFTLGIIIACGGWIFLLFGSGAGVSLGGRDLVNIHMLSVAQAVINLGYALVIIGTVKSGLEHLANVLVGKHATGVEINEEENTSVPDHIRRAVLDRNEQH